MLSKQSIRKEHTIYLNGKLLEKDEMIEISKDFSEKEEQRLRKMLQQGGKIKLQGNVYEIKKSGSKVRNSRGEFESPTKLKKPEDWE
jgi:hypothetical protein|tara:strand:+ start:565 stop:825 length:261 start_codon:yes stop_codon:yes gene_type:complete